MLRPATGWRGASKKSSAKPQGVRDMQASSDATEGLVQIVVITQEAATISLDQCLTRGHVRAPPIVPSSAGIEQMSRVGFYGRRARSKRVDADTQVRAACGLRADGPPQQMWDRWYQRIHAEDRARVDVELGRMLDPRHGVFKMRYRLVGWDGVERRIFDFGRMQFDAAGHPARLQGLMIDITPHRVMTGDDKVTAALAALIVGV